MTTPEQPKLPPRKPVELPPIDRTPVDDTSNAAYSALTPRSRAEEQAGPNARDRDDEPGDGDAPQVVEPASEAQAADDRGAHANEVAAEPESRGHRGTWILVAVLAAAVVVGCVVLAFVVL